VQGESECRGPDQPWLRKALSVQLSHGWSRATPVFDDRDLVSCAGLVPVMALAEQAGLSRLTCGRLVPPSPRLAHA